MYRCFNCGADAVVWNGDFDFSDYGYHGDGIVHQLICMNCGAEIEYRCPIDNNDKENNMASIENKPQVNHIDGNKQNNSFTNLKWVTDEENKIH